MFNYDITIIIIVFKFMHTNRNRFDASFVKVIVLWTY